MKKEWVQFPEEKQTNAHSASYPLMDPIQCIIAISVLDFLRLHSLLSLRKQPKGAEEALPVDALVLAAKQR